MAADDGSAREASGFDRAATLAKLTVRFPNWTIWFGSSTRRWWALPPRNRDVGDFIEAVTVEELIHSIEVIQRTSPHPNSRRSEWGPAALSGPADTEQIRRVPAVAWPGSTAR